MRGRWINKNDLAHKDGKDKDGKSENNRSMNTYIYIYI